MCIILFNSIATIVLPLTKVEDIKDTVMSPYLKCSSLTSQHMLEFKCSRRTRLWDSIADGLKIIVERPNEQSHPHLIVITDGEDNRSETFNLNKISSILSAPGVL